MEWFMLVMEDVVLQDLMYCVECSVIVMYHDCIICGIDYNGIVI